MSDDGWPEDDHWPEDWQVIDTETMIGYANPAQMRAAWGWRRRTREAIADFWHIRVKPPIRDLVWWFKYRVQPKHRYHVIRTGFPPGYVPPDVRIEAAIVNVFKTWIERSRPFEYYETEDPSIGEQAIGEWARIKGLYAYFKDLDLTSPPWDDYSDFKRGEPREATLDRLKRNERLYEEFTNNLCDVIRLRHHF